LVALGIVIVLVERSADTIVLCGIAAGALTMLWVPQSSAQFFRGEIFSSPEEWRVWPWARKVQSNAPTVGTGLLAFAGVVGLVIWATTASSTGYNPPGGGYYTTSTVPTETTGAPVPVGAFVRTWTISASATGGYSMTAELRVGNPQPYEANIINGQTTAGMACSLSSQTDAVIPAELVLTNTTSSFNATPGIDVDGIGTSSIPGITGPVLLWEADYSSGATCTGQDDGATSFNVESSVPDSPGQSSTSDAFFDITDFYSPSDPTSDTSVLADTVLSIPSSFTITPNSSDGGPGAPITYQVNQVTGPGVAQSDESWEFTLAGSTPG
jgi:hypothetical protein